MLNYLTTIIVLTVGLALVFSIVWNRLVPHLGARLMTTTTSIEFPLCKSIQLELKKSDRPKRVILKFNKSVGFYGGNISLKNGESEISHYKLPVLPEYRNKFFGFYNEDIPRQTNTVIMPLRNYKSDCPLVLNLNLNHNIQTPKLRNALDVTPEEEIEIVVCG
jgi:hypothetical protein